jgi:BirA family biotin operon repressor/biotin-[acetyl-CoA-carboxylase] ligase
MAQRRARGRPEGAGVCRGTKERRLGIGINVNQTEEQLPPVARTPPASLRTVDGRCRDRAVLLASLLAQLERVYDVWRGGGLAPLHAELTSRDCLVGSEVEIGGRRGVADGIDPEGRLLLRRGGRVEAIASGEVRSG